MRVKELYIVNDMVVDEDYRLAYIKLLKVLFRLEIIDKSLAMELIMKFTPLFV